MDFLDGVGGKAFVRTIPNTSTLQSQLGVVDFVVDRLFETVVSAVHPGDVSVALHVHANCWVERVSVVNGHTGVVDNHQVAFRAQASVFNVAVLNDGVASATRDPCWIVVHLAVWIQDGHVDLTRVVGRNVDHSFHKESHCVSATGPGWEFVGLAASIGRAKRVTRAVASLCRNNAVRALNEVHEVRLDVSSATVALSVKSDWNDTCCEAVVVGFFDSSQIVCLL